MLTDPTSAATGGGANATVGQEDLTLLANLTEMDINGNLKTRFARDLIYTNIGNVLLSVNPYKAIPFLYDDELIEFYKAGGKERSVSNVLALQRKMRERILLLEMNKLSASHGSQQMPSVTSLRNRFARTHQNVNDASDAVLHNKALLAGLHNNDTHVLLEQFPYLGGGPHVFQLANSMYHSLLAEEESQTVIISGESGAGKTEASKQIINFISYISDKQRAGSKAVKQDDENEKHAQQSGTKPGKHTKPGEGEGEADTIEKIKSIILESNPLMEAFGNAKTVKNDNSSRFGKFFEIYFRKSYATAGTGASSASGSGKQAFFGLPSGGHMSIFLLEKSRVVQQQYGERNFHIFYQMIAGLDGDNKSRLRLDAFDHARRARGAAGGNTVNSNGGRTFFHYLSSGRTTTIERVDDGADFAKTRSAMRVVGITDTVQIFIFEVLATILHLGELDFTDGSADDDGAGVAGAVGGRCRVRNQETLAFVAALLKLESPEELEEALTIKKLEVGERREGGGAVGGGGKKNVQVLDVPLDLAECRNNRDAVAKLLYDAVFNFIVYFINHALTTAAAFVDPAAASSPTSSARDSGDDGEERRKRRSGPREDVLFQGFAENMRQENLAEEEEANAERYLMLGVLDIYGFEIFANNSFEQFCINYINEKLHQIFIDLTLKKEQEEYESEHIVLPQKIDTFFDNRRILNVIEGVTAAAAAESGVDRRSGGNASSPVAAAAPVPGIFQLLDDVCVSLAKEREDVADGKFLEKLDIFLSSSPAAAPYFQKSEKNGFFTVKHYAGSVIYNVNGFVTKNKDKLSNTVLEVLRKSGHIFISEILAPTMFLLDEEVEQNLRGHATGGGGAGRKKAVFLSAGKKIRMQADTLVAKLRSSNIHYIRTIKPNEEKKSDSFVDDCVLHQIQYLGLMENVKIRKMGFIYRNYFDTFLRRFYIIFSLMNERIKRLAYTPCDDASNSNHNAGGQGSRLAVTPGSAANAFNFLEHDDKASCRVLLSFVEAEVARCQRALAPGSSGASATSTRMSFEKDCWQLGVTKVFVRQPIHLATLERLRGACVEAKVSKIQRCYRAYRSERANTLLKQKMTRLYKKRGKARRADSVFRVYSGDYLSVKSSSLYFAHNAARNHRNLLRVLRYDPLAVGWRELFSERDGRYYYVNLFTNESQWAKPTAMTEGELYNDDQAAFDEETVHCEGVQVVFSAKVDRVSIAVPLPFLPASCEAGLAAEEALLPHCVCEEHLFIVTNKAVFLFREVVETGDEPPSASPSRGAATGTSTTSRVVLVKRVDLRLLRGISVSPFADDFVYLHVYPQREPYRPIFLSADAPATADLAGGGAGDAVEATAARGNRKQGVAGARPRKGKKAPATPVALPHCDCCGRALAPAAARANCPCCGRLCCTRTCLPTLTASCASSSSSSSPRASFGSMRPLPNLLGSNVVNPDVLRRVVAEKEAAMAAVVAARAQQEKRANAKAKASSKKSKAAVGKVRGPPPEGPRGYPNDDDDGDGAVVDTADNHMFTPADARRLECVAVCPWCANLEPLEMNEDVVLKTFLRTELAAFVLKEYQRQMGFPLPFHIAGSSGSGGAPSGPATISLSVCVNQELLGRLTAAAARAATPAASSSRKRSHESDGPEKRLLAALLAADAKTAADKQGGHRPRKKGGAKRTADAAHADSARPLLPFSSYTTVTVECLAAEDDGELAGGVLRVKRASLLTDLAAPSSCCAAMAAGALVLTAVAPCGLPTSVIATVEARQQQRRAAHEQRRREEEAALRAKAAAKEAEREETYQRLIEEKKRERRARAARERSARLWKEEEQRQKREAAALTVAERAKRGP